jgi:hypothetical protein
MPNLGDIGHAPMFDFFGFGQQGPALFQSANDNDKD